MTTSVLITVIAVYALLLFVIGWYTSRQANDGGFYINNRKSPWYIVAYGMCGASLSGVTYISEPGWVGSAQFTYMMMVFGYVAGYAVIAEVLLPLYYRLNLTSIYTYLDERFGIAAYKTGAAFFILSRGSGAALRLFLTVYVLHVFIFQPLGISFSSVAGASVLIIVLYSFRGGIRTILWTDTLQTTVMLVSVVITIVLVCRAMNTGFGEMLTLVRESGYTTVVVTDWTDARFYLKQFFGGMFVTIAMTGLDQDMMQKNLSCRNLADARKNMYSLSGVLVVINLMFLFLGALLYIYAAHRGISAVAPDTIFANISLHHLSGVAAVVFLLGLVSAAYSSADGALTALTTSFCIDIIGLSNSKAGAFYKRNIRYTVHFAFAALFFVSIILFSPLNDKAIIDRFFTIAGYTYGPLLGLYTFGLFTRRTVKSRAVPVIAIVSPIITYVIQMTSAGWMGGYRFGYELLAVNGMITFFGLWMFSKMKK